MGDLKKAYTQMLEAFSLMAKRNDVLQDTHGNLSVKFGNEILIKPSGVPYEKITRKSICHYALVGDTLVRINRNNGFKASVDLPHHRIIYMNNPHINSICHTHSPHAVAYAINGFSIMCCTTEQADYFGHNIPCFPYADLDSWGKSISSVGNLKGLIMRHHGVLTFGDSPMQAVNLAIQLENVARKNYLAASMISSQRVSTLQKSEVDKWHKRYNTEYGQR